MELTNEFEVAVSVDEAWAVLTDVERIAPCLPGAELKEIEGDQYRGIVKVKVGPITASYQGVAHFEELDEVAHRAVLKAEGRETRGQGNASATITATLSPSDTGTKVAVATDLAITGKVAQFARGTLAEVSGKLLDQFVHNLETMVLSPSANGDSGQAGTPEAENETASASAPEPTSEPKAKGRARAEPRAKAEPETTIRAESETTPSAGPDTATPSEADAAAGDGAADEGETPAEPEPSKPTIRHIQSIPAEPVDLVGVAGPSIARRVLPFATIAGALFLARIVVYALRRRKS